MLEENRFTWIPFYEEMAQKLLAFKDNRKELVDLVYSLGSEYTDYIYDEQIDENGKVKKDEKGKKLRQRVNDIDPFSVMAIFNRKILDENRNAIVQKFKELLKIEANLPEDYDSIPILMNLKSTLYWRETASIEIPILWNLFDAAMNEKEDLGECFDEIVKYKGIKWNITIVLYWCFPRKFVALDSVSRDFLKDKCGIALENEKITYSEYQDVMNRICSKFNDADFGVKNFPELSNAAYRYAIEKQKVWIAGASISNKPYMEKFYKEGYWEGGPGDSPLQLECLKAIKKGDLIALKTRKGAIPRDDIADLEICYVGIVDEDSKATGSDNTWFSFRVRWFKDFPRTVYPKMYKKPYNGTIGKCTDKKILKDLISFAEEGELVMTETEQKIRNYAALLKNKHNIILQGAPGTGKTYNTAALALSILGESEIDLNDHAAVMAKYNELLIDFDETGNVKNDGQIGFVTFHQSMDYEDFVEGIKPELSEDDDGKDAVVYRLQSGIFKSLCEKAKSIKTSNFEEAYARFTKDLRNVDCVGKEKYVTLKTPTKCDFGVSLNKKGNINLWTGREELHKQGALTRENINRRLQGETVFEGWDGYYEGVVNYLKGKYQLKEVDKDKSEKYVLIIDEINRGNVSKIFGELITLLETDKRKLVGVDDTPENQKKQHTIELTLPYSKNKFSIPSNLYIIGTMNTTDRSVGSIDYAVRRRFAFVTLEADRSKIEDENAKKLFDSVKRFLNETKYDMDIEDLMVGHSYFMTANEQSLQMKWQYEILPLLMEYHKDGIISKSPLKDDSGNEIADVKKNYAKFIEAWQMKESDTPNP